MNKDTTARVAGSDRGYYPCTPERKDTGSNLDWQVNAIEKARLELQSKSLLKNVLNYSEGLGGYTVFTVVGSRDNTLNGTYELLFDKENGSVYFGKIGSIRKIGSSYELYNTIRNLTDGICRKLGGMSALVSHKLKKVIS